MRLAAGQHRGGRPLAARVVLALAVWAAAGCATPGQPATQMLRIETPGCAQAVCELSNDRGSWVVLRTPGEVRVLTSSQPLQLVCRAGDGALGHTGAPSTLQPPSGAGAVAGGAAGGAAAGAAFGGAALAAVPPLGVLAVLTGVAVGAVAGQAVETGRTPLLYPAVISLAMSCLGPGETPIPSAGGDKRWGLGIRGLDRAQAREAGLGDRQAVLVLAVQTDGLAASAGIRTGDIVLAADSRALTDAADLQERLQALPPGGALALSVWRAGQLLHLVLARPKEAS